MRSGPGFAPKPQYRRPMDTDSFSKLPCPSATYQSLTGTNSNRPYVPALDDKTTPVKEAIYSVPNRRNTCREEDKEFVFRLLKISETKNSPPSKKRPGLDEAWIGLFDFFPNNPGDSIIRFSLCPYIVIAKHGKYFCHMGPLFLHILLIRHPTYK